MLRLRQGYEAGAHLGRGARRGHFLHWLLLQIVVCHAVAHWMEKVNEETIEQISFMEDENGISRPI